MGSGRSSARPREEASVTLTLISNWSTCSGIGNPTLPSAKSPCGWCFHRGERSGLRVRERLARAWPTGRDFHRCSRQRDPSDLVVIDELLLILAAMKTDGNIVPPPTLTVAKRLLCARYIAVSSPSGPRTRRPFDSRAGSAFVPVPDGIARTGRTHPETRASVLDRPCTTCARWVCWPCRPIWISDTEDEDRPAVALM